MKKNKVTMKRNGYGFGMDWSLEHNGKSYILGQDAKVCSRVLGCDPRDVINEIVERTELSYEEARDIQDNEKANECLAEILIEAYGLTEDSELEPWTLSVQ